MALLNNEEDFINIIVDLFTVQKQEKDCLSVFFPKDLLTILDFILIYFWSKNSFAVISI